MTQAAAPLAKLDPEALAIRTGPPRAIRFKRWAIITIAAIGSLSVLAVTWMALKPRLLHRADMQEERVQPSGQPVSDTLAGAPVTYGDVPRLGPPLPGDLGKPVLAHQQSTTMAIDPTRQPLEQEEATEQEHQRAEAKAARESGVLVQERGAAGEGHAEASAPPAAADQTAAPKLALDPSTDPNAQARKEAFVSNLGASGDVNPHGLTPLPSPYTLSAGSVISASLMMGLRSDLPGLVTAQVTENTYDSATGRILLIPQGARLIGSYDSVVAFGQKRALIVWQRIILPDGDSVRIDNVPATDPSGYAGLADKVDFHTWQLLKGVVLSTLLGVSSELALSGQSDLVQAIRMSTQNNVTRAGDQITEHNLGVQPTLTIRPGAPVRLVVHKDLVLAPTGRALK